MHSVCRTLLGAMVCAALVACAHTGHRLSPPATPRVQIIDLTPRFIAFYDSASSRPTSADQRWALWKRLDDFAAVPPTPFGDSLARRVLDSAWSRYPAAMPTIRRGPAALGVRPDSLLALITSTLGCGADVRIRLVTFVGGFEDNAFAFSSPDGSPAIAVPVEGHDPARAMVHEFTHALHRSRGCADIRDGYDQNLAELVITEGLAMRMVDRLLPNRPATYSIIASQAWLDSAQAREPEILRGLRPHLTEHGVAQRFTFGRGTTGISREAYYAGWVMVGALLDSGLSPHDIATTPADRLPALAERGIGRAMRASSAERDRRID